MSTTEQQQTEVEEEPLFERAHPVDLDSLFRTWVPRRFTEALIDEADLETRLSEFRVAEVYNHRSEDGIELLLAGPDGTRVFVGEDETSRDSNGLFGYVIRPGGRMPPVRTTQEALDLLTPAQAAAAEMEDATPLRQGEWFLVPTDEEPDSSVFKPGVNERPFGPSPLENHVPTEYALGVPAEEFVGRFGALCPDLSAFVDAPPDAFLKLAQAAGLQGLDDFELVTDVPSWGEVRSIAEPIYVRGTLRHRENDHYMERLGDGWHIAVTHDVDVFTAEHDDLTRDQPRVVFD